jgi:hypothetical protein
MATREQRMADVIIENPILNCPFREPARHFRFADEGITNEIVPGRRSSSYFIPIARPKKKGKQLAFDTEWTEDRIEENKAVNRTRQRVGIWRGGSLVHALRLRIPARSASEGSFVHAVGPRTSPKRKRGTFCSCGAAADTGPKRKRGTFCSCGGAAHTSPKRKRGIFLPQWQLETDDEHRTRQS